MTAKYFALVLAALPLYALAAPPGSGAILIDCVHPVLPSQQQVARLTGLDNFGQVYAARNRLLLQAKRSCKQHQADTVLLMRAAGTTPEDRWIVAIPRR